MIEGLRPTLIPRDALVENDDHLYDDGTRGPHSSSNDDCSLSIESQLALDLDQLHSGSGVAEAFLRVFDLLLVSLSMINSP